MHWIQQHILDQLLTHKTRRFSELRAEGVESNLFQYHLRHVIEKGLVEKAEGLYRLAPAGLCYADRYSNVLKGERPQPKLITVVAIKNRHGHILLRQKLRQPWIGQFHLHAGKVHSGETIDQAAKREIKEKVGEDIDTVVFKSTAHVQIRKSGTIVSDFIAFLFTADYDGPTSDTWYDLGSNQVIDFAPSVPELLQTIEASDGGFHFIEVGV